MWNDTENLESISKWVWLLLSPFNCVDHENEQRSKSKLEKKKK